MLSLFEYLKDLWRGMTQSTSQDPPRHYFASDDIARLHRVSADSATSLDDQTWNDLLLESYEESLVQDVSIFGRQALHRRLRAGQDDAACASQTDRLRLLLNDTVYRELLFKELRVLRHADAEVAGVLFGDTPAHAPNWAGWLWTLPLALLLSIAALATLPLGWLAVAAALAPLMWLQIRFHHQVESWSASLRALHALLAATGTLGQHEGPLTTPFACLHGPARRLHKRLARSSLTRLIPGAKPYADWFCAANVGHYFKTVRIVSANRAFLRECNERCSELEADVALARHLLGRDQWCWAARAEARALALDGGVHPLMAQSVPLSIQLDGRSVFVSGQNASGKSTFLRMVGLNLIAARAFGFCYAARASLPALPVRASMQNEDSLLGGESLYMAELRRARELLDAGARAPGICLIDEVFRGTNHLESVSAACAVLEQLHANGLVLVSSHNLVLAPLLREGFEPFFIDTSAGQPVLAPGVLRNPNGIALLATQGFGAQIEGRAAQVAGWLSSHLAEPASPAPALRCA